MYRPHLRLFLLLLLSVATFPLSGCLFRTRTLNRQLSDRPLKTATQQELVEYVNTQAAKIQSIQATVDIDSSAGDPKNGKITDYKEIRGYVLARKPAMLRMKGLLPVVRNTAFDMVSDGQEFKLWIPPKNKFVMGLNNADNYQPDKRLENMRPQYIYEAVLLPEIGRDEIAVLENGYEIVLDAKKHRVEQPNYALAVIRKGPRGWYLSRRIEFSRIDLQPYRQRIYDQQGNVATDAHYHDYKDFTGTTFPSTIEIERPRENYDITLSMVKLEINKALADDQFALEQPPGADVVHLGQSDSSAAKTDTQGK
ncbi:MAG: outer membrane lipoprotein carrier protein LolA [Terriglobales bacterium]